jgi:hypothetical protein
MNTCLNELMDTVENAGIYPRDFAEDSFALLALALSKLELAERERVLGKIECGDLRNAVALFEPLHTTPYPRVIEGGPQ